MKKSGLSKLEMGRLIQVIKDAAKEAARTEVNEEMLRYKASITVDGKWCCQPMREFASDHFNLSEPMPKSSPYATRLELLPGGTIRYCPFCGVKL